MSLVPRSPHTLLACALVLAGCSSSGSTGPGSGKGSLTVTITPADGTTPSVRITGPHSYIKQIAATQTLSGLASGSYTITPDSALTADSIVGTVVDTGSVTGSPASVTDNTTVTATVTYAREHRIGGMWVSNQGQSTIAWLSSDQLRSSGSPTAADTLVTAVGGAAGLALDTQGNMWVSSIPIARGDTIAMYSVAARNAGGTTAPTRILISTAINNGQTIAFDGSGNLWMANCGASQLIEFAASQLAAGGLQTPHATVMTSPIVSCPYAMAFNTSGDMWVTDGNTNHIVKYSAAQLATSRPTPDTLGTTGGSLNGPQGLAFDANGNLWVANNNGASVVEYTPAQLAAQGAPTPQAIITMTGVAPRGITFDKSGTLWVANNAASAIYGYKSSQIASSGSPTAAIADTLTVGGGMTLQQILLDPFTTGSGVSASRVRPPTGAAAASAAAAPVAVRRRR